MGVDAESRSCPGPHSPAPQSSATTNYVYVSDEDPLSRAGFFRLGSL